MDEHGPNHKTFTENRKDSTKCDKAVVDDKESPDHGSWGNSSSHPPSYDSIFGQFQDTTDGGGNSLEYFKAAVIMFLGTGYKIFIVFILKIQSLCLYTNIECHIVGYSVKFRNFKHKFK